MNNDFRLQFEATLAEVERSLARAEWTGPFERRSAPLLVATEAHRAEPSEARDAAVERWSRAFGWTDEPPEASPPPPEPETVDAPPAGPPLSDQPKAIAAEIGLRADLTLDEINRRWRSFMWSNHPDRRPHVDRELCTRRVAVANGLVAAARQAILARGAFQR